MLRAQLLGGTPSELLGAITGLTEARFPVHAAAHYSDGFPTVHGSGAAKTLVGTTIYADAGRARDRGAGRRNRADRRIADARPLRLAARRVRQHLHLRPARRRRLGLPGARAARGLDRQRADRAARRRTNPRRAARRRRACSRARRSPKAPPSRASRSGAAAGAGIGAGDDPRGNTRAGAPRAAPKPAPRTCRPFSEGADEVYLHPLHTGVAGDRRDRARPRRRGSGAGAGEGAPHILFQIRPAGLGAPLIDPKPILDGWVALENSSIFRAKGENPFLATSPTVGQVLLESKQQLEPQVLHDSGITLGACGRQDVQSGSVDKRVLAMLEYLSVSGLKPDRRRAALRARHARGAGRQRLGAQRPSESVADHRRQRHPGRRAPGPGHRRRHDGAQAADAPGRSRARADRQPDELPRRRRRASTSASAQRRDPGHLRRRRPAASRASRGRYASALAPAAVDQADRAARRDPRPDVARSPPSAAIPDVPPHGRRAKRWQRLAPQPARRASRRPAAGPSAPPPRSRRSSVARILAVGALGTGRAGRRLPRLRRGRRRRLPPRSSPKPASS